MARQEQYEQERARQPYIVHFDRVNFLTHESVILANSGRFLSIGIIGLDPNTSVIMIREQIQKDTERNRKIYMVIPPTTSNVEDFATNTAREMLGISTFEPLDIFSYKGMGQNSDPRFAKPDNAQISPHEYDFYRWYWHKICQLGISIPFSYIMYKKSGR